jgi:hypothetical protein
MANFDIDASTQLKLVKRLNEAYVSLDLNNLKQTLSKNYRYEPLPECAGLPKQTKESHLQIWGPVFPR